MTYIYILTNILYKYLVVITIITINGYNLKTINNIITNKLNKIKYNQLYNQISNDSIESVHLKLTKQLDINRSDITNNFNESKSILLNYLYYIDTNEIIASSIDNNNDLLHFFNHIKNFNNIEIDRDINSEQKIFHLDNESNTTFLNNIWNSGRLLSRSDKFPYDRRLHMKSFLHNVKSSVNRMKVLYKDILDKESILKFLQSQIISNHSYTTYLYNSSNTPEQTIQTLKSLAQWFRNEFPYYRDRCSSCNSSGNNAYAGIVCPTSYEKIHLASVTEMYLCNDCSNITRFPRFNAVAEVLTTRRGRCGEYSALIVRMLDALGYQTRWITDITDHVWAEVLIDCQWIHFDPCEASVNEPFIYQGWGKNQTYVISYDVNSDAVNDVTYNYTSDLIGVETRRRLDGVNETFVNQILSEAKYNLTEYKRSLVDTVQLTN